MFKAGRVQAVVGEAEKMSAGGKHAAEVDRKLQYFRDNFDRMKYDEYILNGWFMGSSVVESACKCVVQQRLYLSGMHWSLKGAAANNTKVAKKELRRLIKIASATATACASHASTVSIRFSVHKFSELRRRPKSYFDILRNHLASRTKSQLSKGSHPAIWIRSQRSYFGFNPTAHLWLPFVPPLPRSSIRRAKALSHNQKKRAKVFCNFSVTESRMWDGCVEIVLGFNTKDG